MSLIKSVIGLAGAATGGGWIPLAVALGIGAAISGAGTWRVMQWHVNEVVAQRDAAVQRVDLAEQDAKRWHDASDVRDGAIAILNGKLTEQSAAVEKARFARDQADQAAARAEADARAARDAFDGRLSEIEAEAKAHPENVVPIGSIVKARVGGLWQ
jgi:hypothetical protein